MAELQSFVADVVYNVGNNHQKIVDDYKMGNKNGLKALKKLKKGAKFLQEFLKQLNAQIDGLIRPFKTKFKYLREVAVLKAGDSFGELSLLSGKPRISTCYAKSQSIAVARLSKDAFTHVFGESFKQKIN